MVQVVDKPEVKVTRKKGSSNKKAADVRNIMDFYIGRLVHDKPEIRKIRKYYNGSRSNKDYAFLEDNNGIGNPASLRFTPLLKSRIDILVGILLSQELEAQVFAIDKDTITKEMKERVEMLKVASNAILDDYLKTGDRKEAEAKVKKVVEESDEGDFISSFQKATQSIVNFYLDNPMVDLSSFRADFFRNLLLYGESVFREGKVKKNEHPLLFNTLAEDVFYMKQKDSRDIGTSKAIIHRRYLTKQQVLLELGDSMPKAMKIRFLKDQTINVNYDRNLHSKQQFINETEIATYGQFEDINQDRYQQYMSDHVTTYYIEYKETKEIEIEPFTFDEKIYNMLLGKKNEKRMYEVRNSGYRIGSDYYIALGEDFEAKRNLLNPSKVEFSFHGVSVNDFREAPSSIGYPLIDINDRMDLVKFFIDNLVSNSGVNGSRINVAAIPAFMGEEMMERVDTWISYNKQGVQLIDPTQIGAKQGDFSQYGDFNNTVDGNALISLDGIIQRLDADADMAAGLNPQMRGIMQERDAVRNVQTGITMVSNATKEYFTIFDNYFSRGLSVIVDNVKLAFPNGFAGSYYKGNEKQYFNLLPSEYLPSQMIVAIKRDDTDKMQLLDLKNKINEMGLKGMVNPKYLILANSATSVQELENLALRGIKKQEDDILKKQGEQLEKQAEQIKQYEKQLESTAKELEALKGKHIELENRKLDLEEKKIGAEISNKQQDLSIKRKKNEDDLKIMKDRNALEKLQIEVGAEGSAKEVKNLKI